MLEEGWDEAREAERPEFARETVRNYPKAIAISSKSGVGVAELRDLIKEELYERYTPIRVRLPYHQGALISLFHETGQVERLEHERGGVFIQGRIPGRLAAQFSAWQVKAGDLDLYAAFHAVFREVYNMFVSARPELRLANIAV